MDPEAGGRPADDRARLGDLPFVVRKHVVDATGVDVELLAEVAHRHGRALEVPAGEAAAPALRRPAQQAALAGGLPEGEVGRVALVRLDVPAMAGPEIVERVAREAAVVGQRPDAEVDVAGIGRIGVAGVDKALGQVEHLRDVLGRPGEHVGREDVHGRLVGVEGSLVGVGDLGGRLVLEPGGDEHPVLASIEALVAEMADIGDVLDVENRDSVVEEDAPDQVREEERPQVPDMRIAVDGRAAGVHPDPLAVGRLDRVDGPGEGVSETKGHAGIVAARAIPARSALAQSCTHGT